MNVVLNHWFGANAEIDVPTDVPFPSIDADTPLKLLGQCPAHGLSLIHI